MKIRKKNRKKIVTIIILLIFGIIAIMICNKLIKKEENNKISLIINNNNVTARLKQEVIIEDNTIYLSKLDVNNFFDKYIYDDEQNNQIITTYDKKIAAIPLEGKTINVNGSEKNIYRGILEKDGNTYLPISEMSDVYNIEITYIKSSNTITMDSLDRKLQKAYAAKNLKIKTKARTISKTIDKVDKGNWIVFISETDKGWAKVRTENGKIGYVKKDKLTNFVTVRENMNDETERKEKINLVWDYFSKYANTPDRTGTTIDGINVVSPSFFYIDENGKFYSNVGESGEKYIKWAHENGYKVWPMVSNSESNISTTSEILNNYNSRRQLVENIVNVCIKYELDGINMDFENMYKDDKDMYSRLIIELTPRLKEIGMVTSVDVTAPDGSETWSLCYDRNVIGDVADYIIFMAYDQYGISSTKSGTTAGYNWVETSLKKFITTEEIKSNKVILGIPFYTRIWTEKGEKISSKTVDMKDIDNVLPNDVIKTWNEDLKQNYVEYKENGSTKKIWIEDKESIKAKLSLISTYDLGGVASWEKDREIDEIWQIIKNELNNF